MPPLDNPRHERFAQELAAGRPASEAYVIAGYTENDGNAIRLKGNERVQARVQEILAEAAAKNGVTVERIVKELAKIGFADIRKAVDWHGTLVREQDNPDGGDVLVIKEIFTNHVRLIDSDKIDEATAAAIAEVRQSPTGGLSIKFHDKRAALVDLGKHLGMFVEKTEDVTPSRHIKQIDARIRQFLGAGGEGEASGSTGGEGLPHEEDEAFPTVPGHGTA